MTVRTNLLIVCGLAAGLNTGTAFGQWSADPASNLRVADRSGEQVQAKVKPTSDGGCYVSWFDNSTGGYDVYLQRLNAAGVEQWPHNGVLIADRGVSSTVDYSLIVDSAGNAVLAYNDDRVVTGTQQVVVQRVDPNGNLLWGATGVIASDTAISTGSPPQVCQTTDGNFVVGWTGTNSVVAQKLDSNGVPLWASRLTFNELLTAPSTLHYMSFSDIQAGDGGSFIVLFLRGRTNNFMSNKSLYAQKFDGTGSPLWTGAATSTGAGSPVVVFDAGTTGGIQIGTFPTFLRDGSGGGVFGWYDIGTPRNAYIQHVLANGSLKFAAPIANTGPTAPATRIRVGAGLGYNVGTGEYYLASPETDGGTQGQNSTFVQKFDSAGNRLWSDTGATIIPIANTAQQSFVQCQPIGTGCMVFFMDTRSATTRVIDSARVNGDSSVAWHNLVNNDSSSDKSRLTSCMSTSGFAIVGYGWGGTGSADIAVQNINGDGSLGVPPSCYGNCDGSTTPPVLNVLDFSCFLNRFAAGDSYANCDQSTTPPVINVLDFSCFLNQFAAGCP